LKDAFWLVGTVAAITYGIWNRLGPAYATHAFHALAGIGLVYCVIRAQVYRNRSHRLFTATRYVHRLMHEMRNRMGIEAKIFESLPANHQASISKEARIGAAAEVLSGLLQMVLDSAESFFRELTGENCHAVLIMPHRSEDEGRHFKSVLYSRSTDPERIASTKPHRVGLIPEAFDDCGVVVVDDYEEEMRKGRLIPRDKDHPFKFYRSAILCHFKVSGERFGVLAVDSTVRKVFHHRCAELLCLFSDALGLSFELLDLNTLGHEAYENPTKEGRQPTTPLAVVTQKLSSINSPASGKKVLGEGAAGQ